MFSTPELSLCYLSDWEKEKKISLGVLLPGLTVIFKEELQIGAYLGISIPMRGWELPAGEEAWWAEGCGC